MTNEDKEFLAELAQELRTQDNCGTRDPKFWMIREKVRTIVPDDLCDDFAIIDSDGEMYDNPTDFANYLYETYEYCGEVKEEEAIESLKKKEDLYDLLKYASDLYAFNEDEFKVISYRNEWRIADYSGAFLTKKEAVEHLKKNRYHYGEDAHPYCYYAERNYELERLINIIKETKWDDDICDEKQQQSVEEQGLVEKEKIYKFAPFDKVLVRDKRIDDVWRINFFSHYEEGRIVTLTGCWDQCVPFEGNEDLVGTTNDPKKKYDV